MTDSRKNSLKTILEKIDDLQLELERLASDEYEDREVYPNDSDEYEEFTYNGASLEDAASFLKDAKQEINDAIA